MKNLLIFILAISSFQVFGQRYEVEKASQKIRIAQNDSRYNLNFQLKFYRIQEVIVPVQTTCTEAECTDEQGDGSTGQWYGFYNVPKAEKPAALAKAVKGIGQATAEKIVEHNLLTFKPRSWSEFKSTIRQIESRLERLGYNNKFASYVVEQYGYENRINLGYGTASSCRTVSRPCIQYVLQETRTYSHSQNRDLTVSVKNQVLQSFEVDHVTITVGSAEGDIGISTEGYNSYKATYFDRGTGLELDGTRIKNAFPINEVSVLMAKSASGYVASINVPAKFFNGEDQGSELQAIVQVCTPRFLGLGCKVVYGPSIVKLVGPNTDIALSLPTGKKYWTNVKLQKLGSQFYSNATSRDKDSNTVK